MTSLHLIYVASVIGALVFFAAGAAMMALRRPRTVEHRVEVPVERVIDCVIEKRVEVPVERVIEKRVEVPVERVIEKRVEVPVRVEVPIERIVEKVIERPVLDDRELAVATNRIAELEHELAERMRSSRDLATAHERLRGRLRDAEGIHAEYVRLRTLETDADFLKAEVARLEGELRSMHVDAVARPNHRVVLRHSSQAPSTKTRSESLTAAIDRFFDDGTRSIAVADTMGFPVASSGNEGAALAAYAALLFESATRSTQFLPVRAPARIELVDEQGTRVSVWSFDANGDRLLLADLAVTPADLERVETTLSDLSAILAPASASSYT